MLSYSHLLTCAAPNLDCASCLHVDDIALPQNLGEMMKCAVNTFADIGEKPKFVSFQLMSDDRVHRSRLSTFRTRMMGEGHTIGGTLRHFTVTSAGFEANALSDTWHPRGIFSVGLHGQIIEAFVQTPDVVHTKSGYLVELAARTFKDAFASAYIFQYPWIFSPLAYASGLSYSPNIKKFGYVTDRDKDRVGNWANHCYRGHRASEGFMREIYAVNLLSECHLVNRIGRVDLETWIRSEPTRGVLSTIGPKWLWEIDERYLRGIQGALDNSAILLSAFPPA